MTFHILREAQQEAKEAGDWYNEKRSGLGEEFLQELEAVYTRIEEHPHRPLRVHLTDDDRELHQVHLRRFAYKVIYEVKLDAIVVVAVAHVRRKPNYWAGRA